MPTFAPVISSVITYMKHKFFIISALLLLSVGAAAQNAGGRITGIVADSEGKFSIADLPEATYTITVDYMGYLPLERKVRVEKGKAVIVTLPLKAEPLSLEQATVTAKSEARMVREQAMPVSVLSLSGNLAYIHFFE